jgi:UDP-N-acetylmuramate--alanine ligase
MINYKNIYFIGIGGIGMSALVRMLKEQDIKVSGSDSSESDVTRGLQDIGVKINFEHSANNINQDVDCVVYTTAVPDSNPELMEARLRDIPIYTYAQMLGNVSKQFETIAVSGTHGKTTTTAMIASAFKGADKKPNVIVGSLLPEYSSNYLKGGSKEEGGNILVTEACEYRRSFLNLNPKHVVITNIEEDHLDYYSDLQDIQNAFLDLCAKIPEDGKIICDPDSPNLEPIVEKFSDKIIDYKNFIDQVPELKVLGEHNKLNAAATLALISIYREEDDSDFMSGAISGLQEFKGTWRRLEARGENENGALLYDDYAHHPQEIIAGINALRENFLDKKIIIFFQPHLYSRTRKLFNEFVEVFSKKDENENNPIFELYFLPIYAAREPADSEVTSDLLTKNISEIVDFKVETLPNFEAAAEIARSKGYDCVVVTMGAGDIYKILDLV